MNTKDYYGKCGSCRFCDLGSAYTFCYSTSFTCTRYNQSVRADEKRCDRFEPALGGSNETIAIYDK